MTVNLSNQKIYSINDGLQELLRYSPEDYKKGDLGYLFYKIAKLSQTIEDHLVILEKTRIALLEKFDLNSDTTEQSIKEKNTKLFINEWSPLLEKIETLDIEFITLDEINLLINPSKAPILLTKKLLPIIK